MSEDKLFPHFNKQIFCLAADEPGITRAGIAEKLNISLSKAGYEVATLTQYKLLTEARRSGKHIGRNVSEFRAHSPICFRIFDLSTRNFSCLDYTVNGELIHSVNFTYRMGVPIDTNLDLFFDGLRQRSTPTGRLMCGLILPSPKRFTDPSAPLRPQLPSPEILQEHVEKLSGSKILFAIENVFAVARNTLSLADAELPFLTLHLGDEVFCVFRIKNEELTVRSLAYTLTKDEEYNNAMIARMAADTMYLTGTAAWHIYAERTYCTVREQILKRFQTTEFCPQEIFSSMPPAYHFVLSKLREYWFDQVCMSFQEKLRKKVAKSKNS